MTEEQFKVCNDCDSSYEVKTYDSDEPEEQLDKITHCPQCGEELKEVDSPLTIKV